jgi:signal peptidase I
MSKRKTPDAKLGVPEPSSRKLVDRQSSQKSQSSPSSWFSSAAIRETVESVIVAFVLAFLFRTFEAEAFVIPTGSMAPTLMGRHKDLFCPKCGYEYQVSASTRTDPRNGAEVEAQVDSGTCPMCHFTADLAPGNALGQNYRSFSGDRILVGKFVYQFSEPRRWDVVVFKYPGDPTTNYIKRMVGLPGETIFVYHGDLWVQRGNEPPIIARKEPSKKLLAMLQPVFDNDYMPKIAVWGMPARWEPLAGAAGGQWSSSDGK